MNLFLGFAGYYSTRIYDDAARAHRIATLLVDARWPWAPWWAQFGLRDDFIIPAKFSVRAQLIELGKLVFIGLTEDPRDALTAECERKRAALESLMAPIVAPPQAKEEPIVFPL